MHWEQMGLLNYNKYFNSIYVFVDALVYSVCDFLLRNAGDKFLLSYVFFHISRTDLVLGKSTFIVLKIYWSLHA